MIGRNLDPLFNFSSVAFVGASDTSHFGLGAWRALKEVGFDGKYYPINPKRDTVHEVPAFPSVADVPDSIDAAVIAVARQHVLPAFEQAADKGAKAVVVLSGNFGESDEQGKEMQAELARMARERGVLLVGPNCMGAASVLNGRALYQGRGLGAARKGNISVVSQSGGLMNELLHYGNARALGFCHMVSSGNEADLSCAEYIDYYARDEQTRVIVAIIETVRDPDLFIAALDRAAQARKPVIVLKLGASEKGARSALTHTGALAGDDAVWDALLEQKAAIRAYDIDELVDLSAIFSQTHDILRKRPLERAGVLEISGGSCELVCDLAEVAGIELPEPNSATKEAVQPTLVDFLSVSNPVDTGFLWTNPAMRAFYPTALDAFASQDDIDIVVSRYIVPPDEELGALNERLEEFDAARKAHSDRFFFIATPTSNQYHPEWKEALAKYQIPFVPGFRRAFSALGKLVQYSKRIRAWSPPPETSLVRRPGASERSIRILNEVEAKSLLADAGLPVVTTRLATSTGEAVEIANSIGYPVAVKVMSPQMTHKSDVGGVRLNLKDAESVAQAFADFQSLVSNTPGAEFEGMSVQAMAAPGLELVIGSHRDPQFGPVIMFGLGGIFIEVLKDTSFRVAPLTRSDAEAMVDGIRAKELLHGVRGKPGVDLNSIVEAILAISQIMVTRPDVVSLDVNPAFAYPDGLSIADARVILLSDN